MKLKIITAFFLFASISVFSQKIKFGKVSKKELEEKFYPADTSAHAVVLLKKQNVYYEFSQFEGWRIITDVFERIKLYDKDGFDHATKKLKLFSSGGVDETVHIKAYTFNLDNGNIVKTKLEKKDIFSEKINKNWSSKNFSMPNLKEGSVVDIKYTKKSPYYTYLDDIICQYTIPIKTLDVKVQIPGWFKFNIESSRYYLLKIKKSSENKIYMVGGDQVTVTENILNINMKDIPALIEEPYVNNIYNYQGKIDFELAAYTPSYGTHEYFNNTWEEVTKKIYKNSHFGGQLDKTAHFKDDLAQIIGNSKTQQEKMIAIFEFVKKKIKWNEVATKYVSNDGIKKAYKNGVGNAAEINLTLVSMLREAGFNANPVLVSTRDNGINIYPTSEGFNYVIAAVEFNNGIALFDATEKYSAPNNLPLRTLNWSGRLVKKGGESKTVNLYPNSFAAKNARISAKIDKEGNVTGLMNTLYTNFLALEYRDQYNGLSEEDLIAKLEKSYNGVEIDKIRINNKNNPYNPVSEIIKFSRENQADVIGDKIYFSPLLFLTVNENPFKLENRMYPIDYGTKWKQDTKISLQIPEGYTVETKPDDIILTMPDNLGSFALKIDVTNNKINILAQTRINSPVISASYYQHLKDLYKKAIEKQAEKIVLTPLTQP